MRTIEVDANVKNEIKSFLNLKRWSIRCERLFEKINKTNKEVVFVDMYRTSDINWNKRENVKFKKNRFDYDIIGCESCGQNSYYYIFVSVL
jgi:hypothetical protein